MLLKAFLLISIRFLIRAPGRLLYGIRLLLTSFPLTIARFVERAPWLLIGLCFMLSVLLGPGVTLLETETGMETLVSKDSQIYQDTQRYQEMFGGEPIVVLLTGERDDLLNPDNLTNLRDFRDTVQNDSFGGTARSAPRFESVTGMVTILETAAAEAAKVEGSPYGEEDWNNPEFVRIVLEQSGEQIEGLLPDENHMLITVTPNGNPDHETSLGIVQDLQGFFAEDRHPLEGVSARVIDKVEIVEEISSKIGDSMTFLLALSVGVMLVILLISFRVRWNLVSLFMVGVGVLWTFGLMGYAGVPLSMATMAVLPILFGLGIDYSIQFHNRYQEEVARRKSVAEAIITSVSRMFTSVGIALLATLIGFVTLYISDVPMIRDFGLMLATGSLFCFIVALFLLHSILYANERRVSVEKLGKAASAATRRIERGLANMARISIKIPLPLLVLSLAWAIAGAVVDHWLPSNSDYEELMPQGSDVLAEIRDLRDITGHGARMRFMVEADNVTTPELLTWMNDYEQEMLERYGEHLIDVTSIAHTVAEVHGGVIPDDQQEIDDTFDKLPLMEALLNPPALSPDKKMASIAFDAKHMPVDEYDELFEDMMRDPDPPEGVRIAPAGEAALVSSVVDAMLGKRMLMNGLCLASIFVVLLLVYRKLTSAVFTIIPVALVIGWASADMYIFYKSPLDIALNPLTAILGVLIIGIGTEFMVLLMGRYEEEKRKGKSPRTAMARSVSTTGRAIVATALTTLGGFGILISSDFVMIRDFGVATTMGVFLCLVSSMIVMPPLVVWWDERVAKRLPKNL